MHFCRIALVYQSGYHQTDPAHSYMVGRNRIQLIRIGLVLSALFCIGAHEEGCATNRDVHGVEFRDVGPDHSEGDVEGIERDMQVDPSDVREADDVVEMLDAPPDDWWNTDYRKRMRIAANHDRVVNASNVPVVLRFPATVDAEPRELRLVGDEGKVLNHEVVQWDGDQKIVWVLVPTLRARTALWLYWGNRDSLDISDPLAVWSEGFEFVAHLENEPARDTIDEVRVAEHNGDPQLTPGIVGQGYHFDGDDWLNFGLVEDSGVPPGAQYTWEVWFNQSAVSDESIIFYNEGFCSGVRLGALSEGQVDVHFSSGSTGDESDWCSSGYNRARIEGNPLALDEWHYLVAVIDRVEGMFTVRLDGVMVGQEELTTTTAGVGAYLTMAASHAGTALFQGDIDEARISSVVRSEDWLRLQELATRGELFEYGAVEAF